MGVTEMRLLVMGTPKAPSTSWATSTRRRAERVILSYTRWQVRCRSSVAQSRSEMPMVTARMSRCSASIMRSVARSSSDSQIGINCARASYAVQRVDHVFVHHHRLQAHRLDLVLHGRLEVG